MTYYLFLLGCQQNQYDAERIAHFLDEMGYVCSDEKNADLIIVLACSVRQSAVDRIYGKLRQWKNQENNKTVILTACVLPADRKKLEKKVDAIIEAGRFEKEFPNVIPAKAGIQTPFLRKQESIKPRFRVAARNDNRKRHAFISIMSGCDNFCSYCAVPFTRGRETSRPIEEIICEAKMLVKNEVREITLLGQNVNSYVYSPIPKPIPPTGRHRLNDPILNVRDALVSADRRIPQHDNKTDFVDLLEQLEKIEGLKKISFLTSHPKDISRSLIEWMGKSKKFSGELHLPLQSGDDEILEKMNRHYTAAQYLNLIKQIKKSCPKIKLSTDTIVGFPGETKERFENTVKLCQAAGFDKAYVAQYSPRPGTAATKLEDSIPKLEKKRRWKILNDLINGRELNNPII